MLSILVRSIQNYLSPYFDLLACFAIFSCCKLWRIQPSVLDKLIWFDPHNSSILPSDWRTANIEVCWIRAFVFVRFSLHWKWQLYHTTTLNNTELTLKTFKVDFFRLFLGINNYPEMKRAVNPWIICELKIYSTKKHMCLLFTIAEKAWLSAIWASETFYKGRYKAKEVQTYTWSDKRMCVGISLSMQLDKLGNGQKFVVYHETSCFVYNSGTKWLIHVWVALYINLFPNY